jgi:molybdopterin-containing oxidoreductase family iron-sulfur binding subunit
MNPRKDLAGKLAALQNTRGKKYWRTLEELAETDAFGELVRGEFPEQADTWPSSLSRRQFLTLMGASLALAGVSGCAVQPAPTGHIVPYVHPPEEQVPGRPLFYATAMTMGGSGVGLLVESHEGRPTKIEGNPDHPASRGATDLFHQAAILTLYDPDRSQTVTHLGQTRTWDEALTALREAMEKQRPKRGAKLRLLTEAVVSPTLARQLRELHQQFPEAKWHQYEPIGRESAYHGARLAFGSPINTYHDFTKADRVLSLHADFLSCGPDHLRNVADFMSRRRIRSVEHASEAGRMNRLYVVETGVSTTGAKADHRLALRASEIEPFARALASRLGVKIDGGKNLAEEPRRWIDAVARDLEQHRGRCVVLAGERQPAVVHLLVHVLNQRLGNVGQTVFHTDPIEVQPVDHIASLMELLDDIDHGNVETLLILDGNPVFDAPADFNFVERIQPVALRAHLSLYQNETSRQCHWHLPEAHFLEAWSDTRAFDGTATVVQPLIKPLYQGRSAHELLSALSGKHLVPGMDLVQSTWRAHWEKNRDRRARSFEEFWQQSLHDGVIAGTKLPTRSPSVNEGNLNRHLAEASGEREAGAYELILERDATIYDGRFANNGWLQELPKPITTLTWDNAALMSPTTARELGIGLGKYAHGGEHGGYRVDVVELWLGQVSVRAPVWIVPGQADGSIIVSLGYGREKAGRVGGDGEHRVGFNAYPLRTSNRPWFTSGLEVHKTGETYLLACTQQHQMMEGREPVRAATVREFAERPTFANEREAEETRDQTARGARVPLTMYKPWEYHEHKWGMVIDLTACTGCKACVVACQAENNIPVVGKDQVAKGREMHWLRIDRYTSGPVEAPSEFHFQPVPCMHCENAPCEYVCPTAATVHSADGLNEMVYQRCVGTRFCSNNCPYKVRRFNFLFYADYATQSLRQQYNPEVTVRSRGVMEKCSYCVQRIRQADINAQAENRDIADKEVLTACQAACPAGAIAFGDLNDTKSEVHELRESPLNYGLLTELNTSPRTTYLAALRNPNPELDDR